MERLKSHTRQVQSSQDFDVKPLVRHHRVRVILEKENISQFCPTAFTINEEP